MRAPRLWLWALLIVVALFIVARCSDAATPPQLFRWAHTFDVPDTVTVTVASVSAYRLRELMAQYGNREQAQAVSVLHKRGDEWSCEVFIGPTQDRSGALAHELRHCHGWVHQ